MQSLSVCSAACEQPLHPNSDLAAVGVSLRPSLFRDPLVISGPLESIAESSSTILEQCYVCRLFNNSLFEWCKFVSACFLKRVGRMWVVDPGPSRPNSDGPKLWETFGLGKEKFNYASSL
ncbi:hypothetical protein AAHA92_12280 [Salvia divinorum]|uniref:Uncharacterized protein n=1 Tax=Salvia divinorum TaxID=28513 RepID=A0ABD1HKQ5_SALDI